MGSNCSTCGYHRSNKENAIMNCINMERKQHVNNKTTKDNSSIKTRNRTNDIETDDEQQEHATQNQMNYINLSNEEQFHTEIHDNIQKYCKMADDEKSETAVTMQQKHFRISWKHIANCVAHEMSPKLGSAILAIIDKCQYQVNSDLDSIHINVMTNRLLKKHLGIDEIKYFKKLCSRATKFVPISIADLTPPTRSTYTENQNIRQTLQDIYDVHSHYKFSNYHFEEYSHVCDANCNNIQEELCQIKPRMNFSPPYVINDDIEKIMNHVFCTSRYIHYLRNNINSSEKSHFQLNIRIITESVECVYDEKIKLHYSVNNIDEYLKKKEVFDYQRNTIKPDEMMQHLYTSNYVKQQNINKLILIVDRRHIECNDDIVYIIASTPTCNFIELNTNYFIGFDFHIDFINDTVVTYLCYGIDEKLRFYPNMLTSLLPRFFKQQHAQMVDTIYSHKYKNGWSVDLTDTKFNNMYKIITSVTHISVNYNRTEIDDDSNNSSHEIICFRDLLEHELKTRNVNVKIISKFNQFVSKNEYDSESIVCDILTDRILQ
eukprot:115351_1